MAKYLNTDGLTHLVELIKNGMAPKEHKHSFSDMIEDTAPVAKQIIGEIVEKDLVNKSGAIGELTVYGSTRQNLWVNPATETKNGVTFTGNADGSITLSGTSTAAASFTVPTYLLRPNTTYNLSGSSNAPEHTYFCVGVLDGAAYKTGFGSFTTGSDVSNLVCALVIKASGITVYGTYRVMLNEGSEPEPWCPPGINGVDELSLVTAGKNLANLKSPVIDSTDPNMVKIPLANGSLVDGKRYTITLWGELAPEKSYFGAYWNGGAAGIGSASLSKQSDGSYKLTFTAKRKMGNTQIDLGNIYIFQMPMSPAGSGSTINRVQVELGESSTEYEPFQQSTLTPIDLDGHALNSLPDGTRDELHIDGTGAVTLVQRVGVETWDGDESWARRNGTGAYDGYFSFPSGAASYHEILSIRTDRVPIGNPYNTNGTIACAFRADGVSGSVERRLRIVGYDTTEDFEGFLASNPITVLYPLATPQEVDLGSVELPSIKSDKMAVYIDANLSTQLEATIIDLPILPIASGGTGADNPTEARSSLDVYSKAEVDSKLDSIEIDEVVPISKGGTGKITAKAAQNALLAVMEEVETDPEDNTTFVMRYASPNDTQGAVFVRKASHVWNYIASKIRSTFGFSSSNVLPISHGGTGATTAAGALMNFGITATAAELNKLDGMTATTAELNYVDGVTSNIQTQLNGKAASSHNHSAANITSGTLPVARGGTGVTTEALIGLKAYPIGSVYISYVSTSPASLFGGTWTPITGVFPYFNAGTATGGSNDAIVVEHTHTATAANAGSHTHGASTNSAGAHNHTIGADDDAQFKEHSGTSSVHRAGATGAHRYPSTSSAGSHSHSVTVNSAGDHTHTITVASAGSSGTGKNMPAYQTLYAWRRTA